MQIYGCNDCKHRWRNEKRITKHHDIWNDFVFHKQTIREICDERGVDKKSVHKYLKEYTVLKKENHNPRPIHLVIDTTRIRKFHVLYASFLNEKTFHPDGSWSYTHEGVRQAYLSIVHWYEYLFTFQADKSIPTTTNTCDGHFSHIKDVLSIHRGMSQILKRKVLDAILLESTIAPKTKQKKKEKQG